MTLEILIQEANGMSDEALREVVRFMKFIKVETMGEDGLATISNEDTGKGTIRSAGMYRGKGWMADDFDEPLSDFKEYM